MFANYQLHQCRQSQRGQSPLRARKCSLHACAMNAERLFCTDGFPRTNCSLAIYGPSQRRVPQPRPQGRGILETRMRHASVCPSCEHVLHKSALALPIPVHKFCLRAVAMLPLFA